MFPYRFAKEGKEPGRDYSLDLVQSFKKDKLIRQLEISTLNKSLVLWEENNEFIANYSDYYSMQRLLKNDD